MPNTYFKFKKFTIYQDQCAMKVTTDACLFGAWCAAQIEKERCNNILDIGSGTGLLSLMIAQKTEAQIEAIEIEPNAAFQAEKNFNSSLWKDRLLLHLGNILYFKSDKKYDSIICNPPFYENELRSPNNNRNLAHHSSALELKELVVAVSNLVSATGNFYLLLPYKRKDEVTGLLTENNFFIKGLVQVRPTLEHEPSRVMMKCSFEYTGDAEFSEIIIYSEQNVYTPSFSKLLKDFYLKL